MPLETKIAQKPKSQKNKKERLRRGLLIAVTLVLVMYLGLSFLAPVLMKYGHEAFAKLIYKAYRPACHQLAYRSFFLFGEQAVYPRALAKVKGLKTYEMITGAESEDFTFASEFLGNEDVGYKVALCQRDIALFSSILLFMLLYLFLSLAKKKIKPLPWWLWIVLAIMPIGLDGFGQLISQLKLPFLAWLPVRESTPFFRVLTGTLFGFFSAWFIILSFEEDMNNAETITHENKIEVYLDETV